MSSPRRDVLVLVALCAAVYGTGLTTHGLTNWQESQRVVVAREMQARGEWIVPTINGQPYLAKPPMMYWAQIGLAKVMGRRVGILELRLVVAVAGMLGVLCTYVVARGMLCGAAPPPTRHGTIGAEEWARSAALWASLCLATGVLYVRSSRIGELDILLVPFVVVAIGAIAAAWRSHRERGRTSWGAVVVATVSAAGAAMTKGPPGVMVIGLAGYGGMAIWYALQRGGSAWGRARRCLGAYARTHPVLVVGVPMLALWGWERAAAARIGVGAAEALAVQEAEENLRLFSAQAPLVNLGAAAYGVGLGSVAAACAIVWLIRDRRRLGVAARPEWFIVLAWVGLGLVAFSVLGKGVGRYLTPLWPGIAMLGGMFIASAIADAKRPQRWRWRLGAVVVLLALGQGLWYAAGREWLQGERSPRAMMTELLGAGSGVDAAELATFEFRTPAIDYYAGRFLQPVGDVGQRDAIAGATPWTIDELKQHLAVTGRGMTVLVRLGKGDAVGRLAMAGMVVETIPLKARFVMDHGKTDLGAVRVHLATP